MAKKNDIIASVLAFDKKVVTSDGHMYGTSWDNRYEEFAAIAIREKSVRGTISNRFKSSADGDPAKLNAKIQNANPQTVDSANLRMEQDTLKLQFTVKFLSDMYKPSACNSDEHNEKIKEAGKKYIEKTGCMELARRYAINIANARFLWRNRVGAEMLEVVVCCEEENKKWVFNAYDYPVKNFEVNDHDIEELAILIAEALSGKRSYLFVEVTAYALLGNGQEIYPSEEMILDKGRGNKSKVLYQVDGIAAMHSQKIGNALRTIDTWYNEYDEKRQGPIAIEPYGAVTNLGKAYRVPSDKKDFYTLFDKWSVGEVLSDINEEHYVVAVLIRGGVFGKSGKED